MWKKTGKILMANSKPQALNPKQYQISKSQFFKIWTTAILLQVFAVAAELNFSASVDRSTVGLGEQVVLTVTVCGENIGNIPTPELPSTQDFTVTNRSSSQSTSIQFINGKMTQQGSISFVYYLSPVKEGNFTIGVCKLTYDGKTYETQPVAVQVIKGSTGGPPATVAPPGTTPVEPGTSLEGELMVIATVSKKTVYQGEQVTAEYNLYSRRNINDLSPPKMPTLNGFWVEPLLTSGRIVFKPLTYNNKPYDVAVIGKSALFPMSSGKLIVDPLSIVVAVVMPPRDFFDVFGTIQNVTVESKPVTITVLPLPLQGRPPEFNGGVGSFAISASLSRASSDNGEPIDLKVVINGTGNIPLIEKPHIPSIPGIRILEPEVKENIQTANDIIKGTNEFRYPILPQADGNYEIPSIRIAYFDPKSSSYKTVETGKLVFVATGTKQAGLTDNQGGLKVLGTDIRFTKPDAPSLQNESFDSDPRLWILYGISAAFIAAALFFRNRQDRLAGDRAYARRAQCKRALNKWLTKVMHHLKKQQVNEYYACLSQSIQNYLGDRYNLETGALTRDRLKSACVQQGIDPQCLQQLLDIIDHCDQARFSPAITATKDPGELFKVAKKLLKAL
ncbi:MAG TPA: BatD family protein [bacterium]